jgi:hypothetical protein
MRQKDWTMIIAIVGLLATFVTIWLMIDQNDDPQIIVTTTPIPIPNVTPSEIETSSPTPTYTHTPTENPTHTLMPTSTPTLIPPCQVRARPSGAIIREAPGSARPQIGVALSTQEFVVVGRTPNFDWWQISYLDREAWVADRAVERFGDCGNVEVPRLDVTEASPPGNSVLGVSNSSTPTLAPISGNPSTQPPTVAPPAPLSPPPVVPNQCVALDNTTRYPLENFSRPAGTWRDAVSSFTVVGGCVNLIGDRQSGENVYSECYANDALDPVARNDSIKYIQASCSISGSQVTVTLYENAVSDPNGRGVSICFSFTCP